MTPDVAIVGAGPAGATLAGLLAAKGLQVILLDGARFPRPKPCGESLNPGAVAMLTRLGLMHLITPMSPHTIHGWRLVASTRQVDLNFPPMQHALAIDRTKLDHALVSWAQQQGAILEQGARVTDLLYDGGKVAGVLVGSPKRSIGIRAKLVIGADGLRSVVARRLGVSTSGQSPPRVAFTAHWENIADMSDYGELHFTDDGVCGIAGLTKNTANVVVVLPAGKASHANAQTLLARWPTLTHRFANAEQTSRTLAIGPFDRPVRRAWAPGALLIGDAAGYFDPLTGQGVYRALLSAAMAAEATEEYLTGDSNALPRYDHAWRAALIPGTRLQKAIDFVVRRPVLLTVGLTLLQHAPPLRTWLMGHIGDGDALATISHGKGVTPK